MRSVKDSLTIKIKVSKENDLFEGKYFACLRISGEIAKLAGKDKNKCVELRSRFYNSLQLHKYNTVDYKGFKCIDVAEPMVKGAQASLRVEFEVA